MESIVALITPFQEDGSLDESSLRELMRWHLSEGTDGLALCGTTGESPVLTQAEWERILMIGSEELKGRMRLLAGTGTNCTKTTVARTMRAKELGMDDALVIVPYYNIPTERGVAAHFAAVVDVGLPVMAYHHPGRTGVRLSHDFWRKLGLPVKECEAMIPGCEVYCGSDGVALEMLQGGSLGVVSVIGNLLPKEWAAFVKNPSEESFSRFETLIEPIELEVNPQGIKCAMALSGLCKEVLRLPLVPVTEQTRSRVADSLSAHARCETPVSL